MQESPVAHRKAQILNLREPLKSSKRQIASIIFRSKNRKRWTRRVSSPALWCHWTWCRRSKRCNVLCWMKNNKKAILMWSHWSHLDRRSFKVKTPKLMVARIEEWMERFNSRKLILRLIDHFSGKRAFFKKTVNLMTFSRRNCKYWYYFSALAAISILLF